MEDILLGNKRSIDHTPVHTNDSPQIYLSSKFYISCKSKPSFYMFQLQTNRGQAQ